MQLIISNCLKINDRFLCFPFVLILGQGCEEYILYKVDRGTSNSSWHRNVNETNVYQLAQTYDLLYLSVHTYVKQTYQTLIR